MEKQLHINFPPFQPDTFEKVKEQHALLEYVKLQKEIEHLKYSLRSYKGHQTRKTK